MLEMRVVYSCVVDGAPKFVMQAFNLVLSLRAVGVAPERVLVNLTPHAAAHRRRFEAMGVRVRDTVFFADGKYCNKVAQLRNTPEDADVVVVCCDTDILFVNNIEPMLAENRGIVLGKIVDFANPPIEQLRAAVALVDPSLRFEEALSDIDKQPTVVGNLNGGLYVLPAEHIPNLSKAWERYATDLFTHPKTDEVLREFAWHIDQIAFCCALNSLELPHVALPIEYNFPLHCRLPKYREASTPRLQVIHYHNAVDENWIPTTAQGRDLGLNHQVMEATEALRTLWQLEAARDDEVRRASQHFTFVMGFHRSGTSLLTAGCERLGYSIGSGDLNASNIDNPRGYFENRRLVKLNEEIMRELESEWDDILFSFDGRQAETEEKFLVPIQHFIEQEFLCFKSARYVLKDPRTMQTYGVWRGAFRRIGLATPEIVFISRNPLECAESQVARYQTFYLDKHDPAHFFGRELIETCLLWYAYNVRFLMTLEDERIVFVRYNDLMDTPASVLGKIAKWAGLDPGAASLTTYANEFLDKGLRHHHRNRADLQAATRLYPQVADLYAQLDALAGREHVPPSTIRWIVERHRDSYAELMHYAFLGRLMAVPRLKWQQAQSRQCGDGSD
jgi:hypothetical protein